MLRFLGLLILGATAAQGPALAQTGRASEGFTREVAQPPVAKDSATTPLTIQMQNVPDGPELDRASVQIGAVRITGLSQLSQDDFVDIAEGHAGRSLDSAGLQALARSVADRARNRGYIFASAMIPPQELEIGIVRVVLDEGAIDGVRFQGKSNDRVRDLLLSLIGPAVRKNDVERVLLLAGDVPGIAIDRTRFIRENGRGILIVDVSEDRTRGSVRVDNSGPEAFGPVRARLEFELNGLIDADDQLVTYTQQTPLQPRELTFVSARYSNIVSRNGLQIGFSAGAGRTRDGDRSNGHVSAGRSRYFGASLTMPVIRSSDASLWVSSEFQYLDVSQNFGGGARSSDHLATFTLSSWSNVRWGNGRLQAGVSVTRGLGILGATRAGDRMSSRIDGSGRFTKGNFWASWNGRLGGGYAMRVAATGQIASRPLLASQEVGFGGPYYGRGYDFSERFGDQGIMGIAELRRGFDSPGGPLDWAQLYGFVDGGYVDNLGDGFGGGTLFSAGGGVRLGMDGADIGVEVAKPINAPRIDAGDRSPKINLTVGYEF